MTLLIIFLGDFVTVFEQSDLLIATMEEDEDKALLSSLGVTSANAEDIERNVLAQV